MQLLRLKVTLFAALHCSSRSSHPPLHLNPKSFSSSSSAQYSLWSGLQTWRESPLNEDRLWGPNGPEPLLLQSQPSTTDAYDWSAVSSASSLAELGAIVLSTSDPLAKSRLSHLAYSKWRLENLPLGVCEPPSRPARPPKPELVRYFPYSRALQFFNGFPFIGILSSGVNLQKNNEIEILIICFMSVLN